MYGQMTVGSHCYIGPQGIVHGTTVCLLQELFIKHAVQITVMNAGRKYLSTESLAGKVFVTSGLGGMSGAQAKAAVIAGCIGVVAEVSSKFKIWNLKILQISADALNKRQAQGWLMESTDCLDKLMKRIRYNLPKFQFY